MMPLSELKMRFLNSLMEWIFFCKWESKGMSCKVVAHIKLLWVKYGFYAGRKWRPKTYKLLWQQFRTVWIFRYMWQNANTILKVIDRQHGPGHNFFCQFSFPHQKNPRHLHTSHNALYEQCPSATNFVTILQFVQHIYYSNILYICHFCQTSKLFYYTS